MTPVAWLKGGPPPKPYAFAALQRVVEDRITQKLPVFDFTLGDPLEPTPELVRQGLIQGLKPVCRYPTVRGQKALRQAAAGWLKRRFGVQVDPETEVMPTAGSKEAVFHAPLAFVDPAGPRRRVLYPTPGYPIYEPSAQLLGGVATPYVLDKQGGFLPRLDKLDRGILAETAIFWINSPHNPTGSVIGKSLLSELVAAAREFGFLLASDECYADIYSGQPPHSALEEGLDSVLAFFSLSKRSGMTGYRSGFVAGDRRAVAAYLDLRPKIGTASQDFVQAAAIAAWNDDAHVVERNAIFDAKRQVFLEFFAECGLHSLPSDAAFYLWIEIPPGESESSYLGKLSQRGIIATPGSAFGQGGEGFFRIALVPELAECRAAVRAWREIL